MWKTVAPAAAVLTAEAVIRRKINALPAETFPLRIGRRVQLRGRTTRAAVQQIGGPAESGPQRCRPRPLPCWRPQRSCASAAGAARRCRSAWA